MFLLRSVLWHVRQTRAGLAVKRNKMETMDWHEVSPNNMYVGFVPMEDELKEDDVYFCQVSSCKFSNNLAK